MTVLKMNQMSELRKQVDSHGGDFLRNLVRETVQQFMAAEVDTLCGASYGSRSPDRLNSRNGVRHRPWDTRTGTIDLEIPKLRQGSYFPDWLLEPRRRSEQALHQVVAECYVLGVSTRRVDKLVRALGIDGIDKSQVSRISQELDQRVEEFRNRRLDGSPYRYLWIDALYIKVREGGRTVGVAVGVATAVNASGHREIIGLDIFDTEDGASWTAFLRSLVARGLRGCELVVSDCHLGLKAAIGAIITKAQWQRCRTHFMRNLLTHVPKSAQDMVATLVRSIFAQPEAQAVREQFDRVIEQLESAKFARAAQILGNAREDLLAFTHFPKQHWRQIWSNTLKRGSTRRYGVAPMLWASFPIERQSSVWWGPF